MVFCMFSLNSVLFSQVPDWNRVLEVYAYDFQSANALTSMNGSVYMAGSVNGPVTFAGVSFTSVGIKDMILSKITSTGTPVWTKQIPAEPEKYINPLAISIAPNGDLYVIASFTGSVTLGSSTVISDPLINTFYAKFDTLGVAKWAVAFAATGNAKSKIAFDGSGNSYVISRGSKLVKVSSGGNILWEQTFPDRTLQAVAVKGTSLFIGGTLQTSTNFGSLLLNMVGGYNTGFLVKSDLNGIFSDSVIVGGSPTGDGSSVSDIMFDASGSLLITGVYTSSLNLRSLNLANSPGLYYTYIAKCDSNFLFEWAKSSDPLENPLRDMTSFRLFKDNSNNLYQYGAIGNPFNFGAVSVLPNFGQYYIQFDPNGNSLLAFELQNTSSNGIYITPDVKILAAGSFNYNGAPNYGNLFLRQYQSNMNLDWELVSNGTQTGSVSLNYVKYDSKGNMYVQATMKGFVNYMGNIVDKNISQTVLAKHDVSGNVSWIAQIEDLDGGHSSSYHNFTVDKDNNVITAGLISDSANIGGTKYTNLNPVMDSYLAKYTANGVKSWAYQFNSDDVFEIHGITTDLQANIIVSGKFRSQINIQGTILDAGLVDGAFVLKFSPAGALIWARAYPVGDVVYLNFPNTDGNNNIYLTADIAAATGGILTFGSATTPQTESESSVLVKLSPTGSPLWVRSFGGVVGDVNSYSWPTASKTDPSGNTYIWGWCQNDASIGTFKLTNPIGTSYSYYLTKISTAGDVVWANAVYEKKYAFNYGDMLDLDKSGNIYAGGHFKDIISLDGNITAPSGTNDFFVAKFSNSGAYQWIKAIPANANIINALSVINKDVLTIAGNAGVNPTIGPFAVTKKSINTGILATLGISVKTDFSYVIDTAMLQVSFTDLSSANTASWYWTMGDGKIVKAKNPVYTYSKPGVYKVCLTAADNLSASASTACKEIRVGITPCNVVAKFSYVSGESDLKTSFINASSGAVTDYFWTFGDGRTSTMPNPVYTYAKPGYYLVTLSVRNNANNCVDSYSQFILAGNVDCRSDFVYNVDPDTRKVSFKDDSRGVVEYYYWDFGDGSFSVDQNAENTYKNPGIYKVGHTVIDNKNNCIDKTVKLIQVGEIGCGADFVTYIDSSSYKAYFTNRILGASTALLWSFGDGKFSTVQNPVHTFPGEGIYSAGLNTYDFNTGCMDYFQENLLIGSIGMDCESDFIYRVDPVSREVQFKNTSVGDIVSSVWNFGDESVNSVDSDPYHQFDKTGYYYVCLSVTNSAGISNMSCQWVLVEPDASTSCLANFMFTIDSTQRKVKFVDNSFGDIDKYSWDFGDSRPDSVSFDQNPVHTYDTKGYYLVKLKAENTVTGCESNAYKLLNVADLQVLKASFGAEAYEPNKKVAGYPVDLVSASSGDGATVEWDFGDKEIKKASFTVMDSTTKIVTHYYQLPGKYRVCLRISDPISGQSDEFCDFVSTKSGVSVQMSTASDTYLDVYPNPLVNDATIKYILSKSQDVQIEVYNQLGSKIETLRKGKDEFGSHQFIWETNGLPSGVYYLMMKTDDTVLTRQLIISR